MESRSLAINILLICREGKSRLRYQSEINLPGISVICVQALMDFFNPKIYCPLNGIMVDMPTYLRSTEEEKRLLTVLVNLLPSLRIRCHEPSGEIRTLPFGTTYPGNLPLSDFIQKYCSTFIQRKIRTSERIQLNLSALLDRTLPLKNFSDTRSVTTNISHEGCFLINFEPWIVGEHGWLILQELEDDTPIPVEICWVKLWGEYRSLPGMGIRFIELTALQKSEIFRLAGKSLILDNEFYPELLA